MAHREHTLSLSSSLALSSGHLGEREEDTSCGFSFQVEIHTGRTAQRRPYRPMYAAAQPWYADVPTSAPCVWSRTTPPFSLSPSCPFTPSPSAYLSLALCHSTWLPFCFRASFVLTPSHCLYLPSLFLTSRLCSLLSLAYRLCHCLLSFSHNLASVSSCSLSVSSESRSFLPLF